MALNKYSNFVRPCSEPSIYTLYTKLNGEDAKKLYLEEVKDIGNPEPVTHDDTCERDHSLGNTVLTHGHGHLATAINDKEFTDKDLFVASQNNDVTTLRRVLDMSPDKINILDIYGWSLLMIACQANSVEVVKELLKRDIDTSIRDKADNSATSLVIRNKNYVLANLLLAYKKRKTTECEERHNKGEKRKRAKLKEQYICKVCNHSYPDKQGHLSSTIHNINASKGKKIPASYAIPTTNKGYQLMVKGGWDRESGLGPEGTGRRNPIRTVQKKDRKGIGHETKKKNNMQIKEEPVVRNKRIRERECQNERRMEALFRRQFY